MANLVLKAFRCLLETDEIGDDSPYFVIFIGHAGSPKFSDVKRIRDPQWDNNVSSGKLVDNINAAVGSNVDSNTLVLVALLEEDNNPDIAGATLTNVKNWMNSVYNAFWANGSATVTQLEASLKPEFSNAIYANLANDDVVAIARLKITTLSGNIPLLYLTGDGGQYRVRFVMT